MARGSVKSADSKNAYYEVGKAGDPNIRVKTETPLFRVIYPIVGDTSFNKTTRRDDSKQQGFTTYGH